MGGGLAAEKISALPHPQVWEVKLEAAGPESEFVGFLLGMAFALLLLTCIAVLASLYW